MGRTTSFHHHDMISITPMNSWEQKESKTKSESRSQENCPRYFYIVVLQEISSCILPFKACSIPIISSNFLSVSLLFSASFSLASKKIPLTLNKRKYIYRKNQGSKQVGKDDKSGSRPMNLGIQKSKTFNNLDKQLFLRFLPIT